MEDIEKLIQERIMIHEALLEDFDENNKLYEALNLKIDVKRLIEKAKVYLLAGTPKNVIMGILTGALMLTAGEKMALQLALDKAENEISGLKTELKIAKDTPFEKRAENNWILAADDVLATVYNAEKKQCNADFLTTASGFKLNKKNIDSHRIVAVERTFMKELGLNYGDVIKIEGAGKFDGVWQVQDTMNKRFAGKHKIDLLTTNKYGMWDDVKLYVLRDKDTYTEFFTQNMLKSNVKKKK